MAERASAPTDVQCLDCIRVPASGLRSTPLVTRSRNSDLAGHLQTTTGGGSKSRAAAVVAASAPTHTKAAVSERHAMRELLPSPVRWTSQDLVDSPAPSSSRFKFFGTHPA